MNTPKKIYYRVTDHAAYFGVLLKINKFVVVKETPCGVWVCPYDYFTLSFAELKECKVLRWIHNNGNKAYCYPTVEVAINSFYRRKLAQKRILSRQLERVELILNASEEWLSSKAEDIATDYNKLLDEVYPTKYSLTELDSPYEQVRLCF